MIATDATLKVDFDDEVLLRDDQMLEHTQTTRPT